LLFGVAALCSRAQSAAFVFYFFFEKEKTQTNPDKYGHREARHATETGAAMRGLPMGYRRPTEEAPLWTTEKYREKRNRQRAALAPWTRAHPQKKKTATTAGGGDKPFIYLFCR
jgi:hypothetical protein